MSLGTLSKRISAAGKRGLVLAATVAAAQLWSPGGAKADPPPQPVWNTTYCTLSYEGILTWNGFEYVDVDYCYWEPSWDGSPYSSGDSMSYYIGIGSTTVYSQILDGSGAPKSTPATDAGDNFVDYASGGGTPDSTYIYDGTTSYEFGLYAHNTDGSSATLWVGAIRDT
jgi:hypothetical protein